MSTSVPKPSNKKKQNQASRALRELLGSNGTLHPALLPGISAPESNKRFGIDGWILGIAGAFVVALIVFGIVDAESLGRLSNTAVTWVSRDTGWLFSALTVAVFVYMLVVGYSKKGRIKLGADDDEPEFTTLSWIAMLFSAGMGIGLLFFGPYEPLAFFLNPPPAFSGVEAGTTQAMYGAIAQTVLHWGPFAWSYYALVGGAIAYSTYRRGRLPLISAILEPIFSERLQVPLGRVIDIFAILVTLFGTAVSLGLGALQIGRGIEIVGGIGKLGNAAIVTIMVVLTVAFIFSAVSGVKKGIRILSNVNMFLAISIGIFVFIAGPTLFILNFLPSAVTSFFTDLGPMLTVSSSTSPAAAEFMASWTTYYWAWWVSWTPFVGMFIARISKGRTLREFVTVVIVIPSIVCLLWFSVMGGTSMWMESQGMNISGAEASQDVLFRVFDNLPGTMIVSIVAMISLGVFFVTSADSAALVMATITEKGRAKPSKPITIMWGLALAGTAVTLLIAGGEDTLSALQALVTVSALPFAIILIALMVAWWKDLSTDPLVLRQEYATVAIDQGVRQGIREHGDDFVFSAGAVEPKNGAGAWLDTEDPALTEWYEEALNDTLENEAVSSEADHTDQQT